MPVYTIKDPQTGRTMKVRGESPPTEQELTDLFAQDTPAPEFKGPSLHAQMSGPQKVWTEQELDLFAQGTPAEGDFLSRLNARLEPVAKPWMSEDPKDQMSNISSLLVPFAGMAPAVAKGAGPALGKAIQKAGQGMEGAADTMSRMNPLARLFRHMAASGVGAAAGGPGGAVAGAAFDMAAPPAMRFGGKIGQKVGRWLRGTTALDDIPAGQRPRLVKPSGDPLADALSGASEALPESVSLPDVPELPAGGWVKNAAGERVYTSDIASGRHDIPGRGARPAPAAPSSSPRVSSQPMSVGGQLISESDPLFNKLKELMGPDAAPAVSHEPTVSRMAQPIDNRFQMPHSEEEWIEARRLYGARKVGRLTGKTSDEIRRLAPGPSRIPLEAEERIRAFKAKEAFEERARRFWSRD